MTKQDAKGYVPVKTADLSNLPRIKGYDFNKEFNLDEFLKSYATTGIQASNLASAIQITKAMRREKATIFLSYTSNMVSSGIREIIAYLVKNKLVHVLITNAGGIEEDFLKCFDSFRLGNFEANGKQLFENGVNRIGNIFVTNDFYTHFEEEMHKILDKCYREQKENNRPLCTSEIIKNMGAHLEMADFSKASKEDSILYWAHKNDIPIFAPAFTDGSIGDMIYFNKNQNKDLYVDIAQDMQKVINISLNAEKTGIIALGGGSSKHYSLNAQIFREGADFAVLINTHHGYDASDSGAEISESITWAKIKANAPQVKVNADASIVFPLIVAGAFISNKDF
ncbi:deoxyhypusine synthase [Candidatus Woesearchaeota archaeon]|nr:deoxyhypusine synthase [Candidatus Woesearchaeota archaeon]